MDAFKSARLYQLYLKVLLIGIGGAWVNGALGSDAQEFPQFPALKSHLASKALLVDSEQIGGKVIAVGAYGNVVVSNNGADWRQGEVPTRRLLTSVEFIDEQEGWAAGHDTLILHTTDGGISWEIQYADPWTGGDIPKPVLDLMFSDNAHGYAVGAFALLLKTEDGGKSWETVDTGGLYDTLLDMGLEPEPNFYAIKPFGEGYLIVGELGTVLYFNPSSETQEGIWTVLDSPYEGTFFGAEIYSENELVIYGLRGHMFHSRDRGQTWEEIDTGTIANINSVKRLPDGSFIAVGDAGTILKMRLDNSDPLVERIPYKGFDHILSAHYRKPDQLLLFGTKGAQVLPLANAVK